jgi:hypothetical protein
MQGTAAGRGNLRHSRARERLFAADAYWQSCYAPVRMVALGKAFQEPAASALGRASGHLTT